MNTPKKHNRYGATALEAAITLPVLLLILFALLDLGLAATRYNALSEIARRIAREAIWHGSLAPSAINSWGPQEYVGAIGDGNEITTIAQNMTPTMNANDVSVRVTWPDSDNTPRDRVSVEVGYEHQPLVPAICPWGTLNLSASTTMRIVN